jgi:hypothetical protein
MGRASKRKIQSQQAAAHSAARTRKRRPLGDAEPESHKIESQFIQVQKVPEHGMEVQEEERPEEQEGGAERENEYLQSLIAGHSAPPNPEGSFTIGQESENQSPAVRNPIWLR